MEPKTGILSLPTFSLLLLLSLLLILLENLGWTKAFWAMAEAGIKPPKKSIYRFSQKTKDQFLFLTFWKDGQTKIKILEEQVQKLAVEAQKIRSLEEENKILRAQIGAPLPKGKKQILAETLGFDRYLTLDKGENDGVKNGQAVILEDILLGKVVKVLPWESQAEVIFDPDSKIAAKTVKTQARGILAGQFGKGVALEKVTQEENLEVGDYLATTGEGDYPQGLLLGTIEKVERTESEIFQKAQVRPLLDPARLTKVFILGE